jgi:hypothetical protein
MLTAFIAGGYPEIVSHREQAGFGRNKMYLCRECQLSQHSLSGSNLSHPGKNKQGNMFRRRIIKPIDRHTGLADEGKSWRQDQRE